MVWNQLTCLDMWLLLCVLLCVWQRIQQRLQAKREGEGDGEYFIAIFDFSFSRYTVLILLCVLALLPKLVGCPNETAGETFCFLRIFTEICHHISPD